MQRRRRRRNPGAKAPGPKDVEIGQRIRAQRLLCRLSQTELADAIGVTFQQVQKYELGGRINEALGLLRTAGAMRLVRAFEAMPADARGHFLALVEVVAERGRPRRTR